MKMAHLSQMLLFFISFNLDVKLKAHAKAHPRPQVVLFQYPELCLRDSQNSCAIKSFDGTYRFEDKSSVLHLLQGAVLKRSAAGHWELVQGTLWIEKSHEAEFKTIYGKLTGSLNDVWISVEDNREVVRNSGREPIEVEARDGQKIQISTGFQVWVGGVGLSGQSLCGMIEPIPLKQHIFLLSQIFGDGRGELLSKLKVQRLYWGNPTEDASEIYKAVATRHIASLEVKKKELVKTREAEKKNRQKARSQFLQRAFER